MDAARRLERLVSGDHTPASEAEVAALEERVGPLPGDYRDFLLSYGGAVADEEVFLTDADGRSIVLLGFYGLSEGAGLTLDEDEPALADGLVPIAESGMGDMFYVDARSGRVYRDDDEGDRELSSGTTLAVAADSVTDLLDRISDPQAEVD